MKAYLFNSKGYFIGTQEAQENPIRRGEYLLPRNAAFTPLPPLPENTDHIPRLAKYEEGLVRGRGTWSYVVHPHYDLMQELRKQQRSARRLAPLKKAAKLLFQAIVRL